MEIPSTGSHISAHALDRSSDATSSGRGLTLADLPVRLVVREPALAAEVAELFGPMAEHDGPYAAEIVVEREAPRAPGRGPDEVYEPISLGRDGEELVVDSGGPLRAHATATRAVIGGAMGDGPLGTAMLRRIVHHVIAHLLSVSGRLVAHGAAVGRGGQAVLLLGPSGSGKSTSAYLASRAGWTLLSDDLVVVRRVDGGAEATGIHRAIAVPPEVATADAAGIDLDFRGRRRPDVVLDARPHRLAAVALVQHGSGAGAVESVDGLEVARAFVGSTPAAGNVAVAAEALNTAALLARLTRLRLRLPDSAEQRLAGVAGLFEQIAAAAAIGD